MDRKYFIQIFGFSLAGLLLRSTAEGSGPGDYLMEYPDEVWIETGGKWILLKKDGRGEFYFRDVSIRIHHKDREVQLFADSPTQELEAVRFKWKFRSDPAARCLGDSWERTYGDISWQQPARDKKMPWYFLQLDKQSVNCFGVKTGCGSICYWEAEPEALLLTCDTRCGGAGVLLGQRQLHLADILATKSLGGETVFQTGQRFCTLMCPTPRLPKQPVYGINDWYFAYGNNSASLILGNTALMSELVTDTDNRPFSVIDAGWAAYSPQLPGDCCWQDDYSRPNEKFRDMHKVAGGIRNLGMRPGLWTRPLGASYRDKMSVCLPLIPGRDNPKTPVLDPSIEENIERIKGNFLLYRQWGYELVKHDYTTYDMFGKWGFQMTDTLTASGWNFYDRTRTTAEIINRLYTAIRTAAGEIYLIGCNTMSHLAAGLFELNRIGDDTSGNEWERTRKMGVNTLGFRIIQHRHFYEADGDCVGLTTKVPWEKNKQWMQLLAQSSTPLFISAEPDALGTAQKKFIKKSFAEAAVPQPIGEPLDWLETTLPAKWKLDGDIVVFDWS